MLKFRKFLESKYSDISNLPGDTYWEYLVSVFAKLGKWQIMEVVLLALQENYKFNTFDTQANCLRIINQICHRMGVAEWHGEFIDAYSLESDIMQPEDYIDVAATAAETALFENDKEVVNAQAAMAISDCANAGAVGETFSYPAYKKNIDRYISYAKLFLIEKHEEKLTNYQKETLQKLVNGGDLWEILTFVRDQLDEEILDHLFKIYNVKDMSSLIAAAEPFKEKLITHISNLYE